MGVRRHRATFECPWEPPGTSNAFGSPRPDPRTSFDPGEPAMAQDLELPDYAPLLAAYHAAFAVELEGMVRSLPIPEGAQVLEMACGDGAYTPWLARKVGPAGSVVGLDLSPAYLALADRAPRSDGTAESRYVAASIDRLPFADATFDAVWCAQSLFSLPEPVDAVRRMAGVVKPGGLVAVLEDDTLHQVLLPWPIELELAVRVAQWDALRAEVPRPGKFYVGRRLITVFREAGLVGLRIRTFATDRVAPLAPAGREFLAIYLDTLRDQVSSRLDRPMQALLDDLATPGRPAYLLDQTDFAATLIDHVVHGTRPADRSSSIGSSPARSNRPESPSPSRNCDRPPSQE